MSSGTTSREFFELKYAEDPDPWNFATSSYELDRYATTLEALGARRYRRAFEPGCSVGVLTASLAPKCDSVAAIDISSIAVARARKRCQPYPNVTITCAGLPEGIPSGSFDLIVLSEICYYFGRDALRTLADTLVGRLESDGVLIAVHWLGSSEDHLLGGNEVHEILRSTRGIMLEQSVHHNFFRLDRWSRS